MWCKWSLELIEATVYARWLDPNKLKWLAYWHGSREPNYMSSFILKILLLDIIIIYILIGFFQDKTQHNTILFFYTLYYTIIYICIPDSRWLILIVFLIILIIIDNKETRNNIIKKFGCKFYMCKYFIYFKGKNLPLLAFSITY